MGEATAQVIVVLDGLHKVGNGTGQTIAFTAFDPRDFTFGYDLYGDSLAAVADSFDAHLAYTRILGVEEVGCLEPGRIGDV